MNLSSVNSIVVLTGAGISAESGIQTFRDNNGLWENYRVEEVASPQRFAADPVLVHRFYNMRRHRLLHGGIEPNTAHLALARLEWKFAGEFLLVTQNIDNLHERAGSQRLLHMHGEILKMRCSDTGQVYPIDRDLSVEDCCECCNEQGRLRPHVVWFGEMPMEMDRIYNALENCDLFISIGTSGNVYPAAGFVQLARESGAHTVEINLEPSAVQSAFHAHIYGPAGEKVPEFTEGLLHLTGVVCVSLDGSSARRPLLDLPNP